MFISEVYKLQDNKKIDGKIITVGELVVKAKYIFSVQVDTTWYCNKHPQQHVTTVLTRTKLHPRIEVNAVTDFHVIPKSVCNRTQAKQSISRQPVCFTDSDYDFMLE